MIKSVVFLKLTKKTMTIVCVCNTHLFHLTHTVIISHVFTFQLNLYVSFSWSEIRDLFFFCCNLMDRWWWLWCQNTCFLLHSFFSFLVMMICVCVCNQIINKIEIIHQHAFIFLLLLLLLHVFSTAWHTHVCMYHIRCHCLSLSTGYHRHHLKKWSIIE